MFTAKNYVRAKSLDEAYELNQKQSNLVIGGMIWSKMMSKSCDTAIDLCDLGLDKVTETEDAIMIGAMVPVSALETNESILNYTNGASADAVKGIVGTQLRNTATIGGSIWARFGFSDILTLFLAIGAKVVLHKAGEMSLEDFIAMDRHTRDILTAVILPKEYTAVSYRAQRNISTDFPVATAAVAKGKDGYVCAVGARPMQARLIRDEKGILSGGITEESAEAFASYAVEGLAYGSDIRAGSEYRRRVSKVMIRRALLGAKEG